jgi:hypothetical protein
VRTGQYTVKLKIVDLSACSQTDSTTRVIHYFKDNIQVGRDDIICEGSGFQLNASGGVDYRWTGDDGTFASSEQSPIVYPDSATSYFVTVVDGNGCSKTDTLNLIIRHDVHAFFQTYDLNFLQPGYNNVCYPDSIRFKNQSLSAENIIWDFDDGLILPQTGSDTTSTLHGFPQQGVYR